MDIAELIVQSMFTGFGWSVICSYFLRIIKQNSFKEKNQRFSDSAIILIRWISVLWLFILLVQITSAYNKPHIEEGSNSIVNLMFGPYWFLYWVCFFAFCAIPQLFWIDWIKKSMTARFLYAVFLILVLYAEKIVILVTSFHRDYISSGWSPKYNVIFFNAFTKTSAFVLLTLLVSFVKVKQKKKKLKALDAEE